MENDIMKKMTKREKFELLLTIAEVQENEMLVEFINHELELLAKKNATGTLRKPTKTQIENENLIEVIFAKLQATGEGMTISEIQVEEEMLEGLTNQKMSALLKKLVDSQRVEKYIEKKKTFFKAI
jgi:hypothetical protein